LAVIATWRGKTWEVSPKKIMALEALATSYELEIDSGVVLGKKTQELTLTTAISAAAGLNVRSEIDSWSALVGQTGPLIIGEKRFGPAKVKLIKFAVTDILLDDIGRVVMATLSMTYNEDPPRIYQTSASEASGENAGSTVVTPETKPEPTAKDKVSQIGPYVDLNKFPDRVVSIIEQTKSSDIRNFMATLPFGYIPEEKNIKTPENPLKNVLQQPQLSSANIFNTPGGLK